MQVVVEVPEVVKLRVSQLVDQVEVELVWEPIWGREMMSEAARLELGMM